MKEHFRAVRPFGVLKDSEELSVQVPNKLCVYTLLSCSSIL